MYQIIKYASSLKFKELPLSSVETLSEAMFHIKAYVRHTKDNNSYYRIKDLDTNIFVGGTFERSDFEVWMEKKELKIFGK